MKTATVRDLRTRFPRVEAWLKSGETVNLTRHGLVIGRLTPPRQIRTVNFKAQMKALWGRRTLSSERVAAVLRENRGIRS